MGRPRQVQKVKLNSGGSDSGARKIRLSFFNWSLEVGSHRRLWSRGVTQVEP